MELLAGLAKSDHDDAYNFQFIEVSVMIKHVWSIPTLLIL